MKGYKVFNPDWTCQKKQYAVGKTATQNGELELCKNGIHFCMELADCFCYYSVNPGNKLAEVEALGNVLHSDKDSKCCTDRLKVVRELSIAELLKDKNFCLEVVKRDPGEIQFMKGQDREVFLAAVKQDGGVLECIPEDLKTPEICLAAVQQDSWVLQDVPEHLKTPVLCLAAVKQNGRTLQYVPESLRTPRLCLKAVKNNGWAVEYVPENLITPKICLAAVKQNGMALLYVKEQTPEICRAAVDQCREAVRYIQDDKLKKELMV